MQNPVFSIIIPTFNSAATITPCLESIFEQNFSSFEILIIDSVSNDDTLSIINNYSKLHSNIKIFSEKDKGIYDAMNKGIDLAKGEWLFFLGSDDVFYNSTVLTQINKAISNCSKKVIYGNVEIRGNCSWAKNGDIYAGIFSTKKLLNQNICHQAIFYNRFFILNNIGNYRIDYIKSADWDFNLKCWAQMEFQYSDLIISKYSVAGFSGNNVDIALSNDFVTNMIAYFGFSLFDPMINNSSFAFYNQLLEKQKKDHYFRFIIGGIGRFFSKLKKKIASNN